MFRWTGGSKARATLPKDSSLRANITARGASDDCNNGSNPTTVAVADGRDGGKRINSDVPRGGGPDEEAPYLSCGRRRSRRRSLSESSSEDDKRGVDCLALDWSVKAATTKGPEGRHVAEGGVAHVTPLPTAKRTAVTKASGCTVDKSGKKESITGARRKVEKLSTSDISESNKQPSVSSFSSRFRANSLPNGVSVNLHNCPGATSVRGCGSTLSSQHSDRPRFRSVPSGWSGCPAFHHAVDDVYIDNMDRSFYRRDSFVPSIARQGFTEEVEWLLDVPETVPTFTEDYTNDVYSEELENLLAGTPYCISGLPSAQTGLGWLSSGDQSYSNFFPRATTVPTLSDNTSYYTSAWFGPSLRRCTNTEFATDEAVPTFERQPVPLYTLDIDDNLCLPTAPTDSEEAWPSPLPTQQSSAVLEATTADKCGSTPPLQSLSSLLNANVNRRRTRRKLNLGGEVHSARFFMFQKRSY